MKKDIFNILRITNHPSGDHPHHCIVCFSASFGIFFILVVFLISRQLKIGEHFGGHGTAV